MKKKMIRYGILWTSTEKNNVYSIGTESIGGTLRRELSEVGVPKQEKPDWKVRLVKLTIETVKAGKRRE